MNQIKKVRPIFRMLAVAISLLGIVTTLVLVMATLQEPVKGWWISLCFLPLMICMNWIFIPVALIGSTIWPFHWISEAESRTPNSAAKEQ